MDDRELLSRIRGTLISQYIPINNGYGPARQPGGLPSSRIAERRMITFIQAVQEAVDESHAIRGISPDVVFVDEADYFAEKEDGGCFSG